MIKINNLKACKAFLKKKKEKIKENLKRKINENIEIIKKKKRSDLELIYSPIL